MGCCYGHHALTEGEAEIDVPGCRQDSEPRPPLPTAHQDSLDWGGAGGLGRGHKGLQKRQGLPSWRGGLCPRDSGFCLVSTMEGPN